METDKTIGWEIVKVLHILPMFIIILYFICWGDKYSISDYEASDPIISNSGPKKHQIMNEEVDTSNSK